MKKLNPAWVKAVSDTADACGYFQLQSMCLAELKPGEARLEIELGEKHLQPFGIVHGGVLATIIDAACFWAVYADAPADLGMTTVDLKLNYLAPAVKGKIVARGKCIRMGKTVGLGEAQVEDEQGRLLAHGLSTLMVLPLEFAGGDSLPAKFL